MQISVVKLSQFRRECCFRVLPVAINESPYEPHSLSLLEALRYEKRPRTIAER
jgi:hypothetical protein